MKIRRFIRFSLLAWAGFSSGAIFAGDFAATTAPVGRNGETLITPASRTNSSPRARAATG